MKFLSFGISILALVLTAGCNHTFKTDKPAAEDSRITVIDTAYFSMKPLEVSSYINDEGLFSVSSTLEISNTGYFTWTFNGSPMQQIEYRYDWVDAKGNVTKGKLKSVKTLPGTILTVSGVAPEEKYTSFKLMIRFADKKEAQKAAVQKAEVKKPVAKTDVKQAAKKAETKPAAKPAAKKAETKPAAKPAAKNPVGSASPAAVGKDGKLAESFK